MQPVYLRLGTFPGKFPSSQHGAGRAVESLNEVLVHHSTQVTPKQPSGELPLSAVAVFLHERSSTQVLGTQPELQPQQRLQHKIRRELKELWTRCCSPGVDLAVTWGWGVGGKCLLKCGFLFSSTPLAWQWVCDPFSSVAMKTTVSWPSPESYCRRKLFVPVYSLTKGSQTQSDPPGFFFPTISPILSRKWVPNMLETTAKSGMREVPEVELQAPVCVCTCVGQRGACVCDTPNTHTLTDPRTL